MLLPGGLLDSVLNGISKKGKRTIKNEDWVEILDDTRGCLKPHLNTFANTPLGHISLWGNKNRQTIESDLRNIPIKAAAFPLSTPGFWAENYHNCSDVKLLKDSKTSGITTFWGITRKGDWAIVRLAVQKVVFEETKDGDFMRYKAVDVYDARTSSPCEISKECERDFFGIFDTLFLATYSWSTRREELARSAKGVHDSIEAIHQILRTCER